MKALPTLPGLKPTTLQLLAIPWPRLTQQRTPSLPPETADHLMMSRGRYLHSILLRQHLLEVELHLFAVLQYPHLPTSSPYGK
jgi:hypothetical protein